MSTNSRIAMTRAAIGAASTQALIQQISSSALAGTQSSPLLSALGDGVDVASQLSSNLLNAADRLRSAQSAMSAARQTESDAGAIGGALSNLRGLAKQAARTDLTEEERAGIASRFSALQKNINGTASTTTVAGGGTLATALSSTGSQSTTSTTYQVTGQATVGGRRVNEQDVALADSRVAQARGLQSVQVSNLDEQSVVRFTDTGNGQITATRYNQTANGLQEVGSQIVAAPAAGDTSGAGTTAASFDRLGVQLTLNQDYTAGDLNGMEVTATPAQKAETQSDKGNLLSLSVSDAASAEAAVSQIDRAIGRATSLGTRMRTQQQALASSLASAMSGLEQAAAGSRTAGALDTSSAEGLATALRKSLMEQTSTAMLAQAGLDASNVLRLIGG